MNYKIHAGSNTELIQQRLFDHGYQWTTGDCDIEKEYEYLYFEDDKTIATNPELDYFLENRNKELTLTEFFDMFPEKSLSDKVRSKLQGKIDVNTIKEICEMIDMEVKHD